MPQSSVRHLRLPMHLISMCPGQPTVCPYTTAMTPNLEPYLDVAVRAARAAGAIHLAHAESPHTIDRKSSFSDLVTEVDRLAEAEIRRIILAAYPGHAILGEEEGEVGGGAQAALWVVDPLDGTVNYAHGLPIYCASVGLELDGERAVGAVYDPSRGELFTAVRGGGARLNGRRITVSGTGLDGPPLVATGFAYDSATDQSNVGLLSRVLAQGWPVRRPGAAALDLCNVACGRMDAYWELGLKRWDSAAGSLIVEEAGGQVTGAGGEPTPYAPVLVASNGMLHPDLLRLLAP